MLRSPHAWKQLGALAMIATVIAGLGVPIGAQEQEAHLNAKAEAEPVAAAPEVIKPAPKDPELCLSDPIVLDELKRRREVLETREKEMEKREAELLAKSKAIEEELSKMQGIRDEIAQIDLSRAKENEERVSKLIETLQMMSPKPASKLVATLDEGLAVATLSRMDNAKLAKLLALMEPDKASRLSELMAGVVRAKSKKQTSAPTPERKDVSATTAVPAYPANGGEKKYDATHANEQQSGTKPSSSS